MSEITPTEAIIRELKSWMVAIFLGGGMTIAWVYWFNTELATIAIALLALVLSIKNTRDITGDTISGNNVN